MAFSIEQSNKFHMVRRMAKVIAPEYRLFSTTALETNDCVLDLSLKTIEVGEGTDEMQAIAAVLFQLGHIRQLSDDRLAEHFGIIENDSNENHLVAMLVQQGRKADKNAYQWAVEVLCANWAVTELESETLLASYIWTNTEWHEYYTAK